MAIPIKRIRVPNFKINLSKKDKAFIRTNMGKVLNSSRWTSGPVAEEFEEAFKNYAGAPYAVAVSNGGAAIVAILQALHIPKDSVIICPTLTAPPTPHAILLAGMRVVFADSNLDDLGLNVSDVERKIKRHKGKVRAVIAVHVGGWISPRIKEINQLCKRHGIFLIEDCAHAHGSFLDGKHAGSTGIAAAYSFFMTKTLTCGEGGIVTSKDKRLIDEIRIIRNYGKNEQGIHMMNGFNYKFSEFNAAIALWATANASRIIRKRRAMAFYYDNLLKDTAGISVLNVPRCLCGYYKYIVNLTNAMNRDKFKEILLYRYGIEAAGGVYDVLCHQEPYFKSLPRRILNMHERFPCAERFSRAQVCLPLYLGLKRKEQRYVVESMRSIIKQFFKKESSK